MANEKPLDLIDRNELLPNGVFYVNGNNPKASLDELLNRIATAQTVDAVEVVHGRWIDRPSVKGQVYCSECATIEKATDSNYKSKHCPNCGAKMDGGDEEAQQDCTYNRNGHCMGQKLMPECDPKACDRRGAK